MDFPILDEDGASENAFFLILKKSHGRDRFWTSVCQSCLSFYFGASEEMR